MDINTLSLKEGLKWKCRQHPQFQSDIICLDGDVKDRVMCLNCAKQQFIPLSNLLTMSLVLSANEHDILEDYPPLKDQEISERLRQINLQFQLEEIEAYFKKLREDIEKEVKAAEKRTKEALIKQDQNKQELLESYKRIAEIEKLKKLIVSKKESAEEDLDAFIKEKWSKTEENRNEMKDLMDQHEAKYKFSSNEPNKITQEIIERLKTIDFFQQSMQTINLIKSTLSVSQTIQITKINDSTYHLQQGANDWGQVFIDPILNPLWKYVLQIELERNSSNGGYLYFGLMQDEGKDNSYGDEQNMCYQDNYNQYGITKQIKGNPMPQANKIGKKSFEVRIHLNKKILRVASLPDYSSIAELDDPQKINPKVAYRFFFGMEEKDDWMRITNFRIVSEFDEKM